MEIAQVDFTNLKIPVISNSVIDINSSGLTIGSIFNTLLPYIFTVAGLLLLLYLIYGGYHLIIAAGDQKGLQEARGKIINALTGFVIIFASYWVVKLIGKILGLPTWGGFF